MVVVKGNTVKVDYEGRFVDGVIFDSSIKHGEPLEFVVGEGMVVSGFDSAVLGMEVGEEKEVTLKPSEAYGEKDPRAIQKVSKANFPPGAKVGLQIGIPLPNGEHFPAEIVEIDEKFVTIDMNHPMAGKTLVFKIKLVEIANS